MANEQNLRPAEYKLTLEEQKKGGIKSGEARRAKKGMQNIARWLLEMPLNKDGKTPEDIKSFSELAGVNLTVEQAILIKQLQKAMKGDIQSATFVRDTSGQKPKENIGVTGELNNPFAGMSTDELRKIIDAK